MERTIIVPLLEVAEDLELAGLIWQPEIGDEIADKKRRDSVSILVDPRGMTPSELRASFLWLPTVEQLVHQFEARQAILFHAGLELSSGAFRYKTVIQTKIGQIEVQSDSLRMSMGIALRDLLLELNDNAVH